MKSIYEEIKKSEEYVEKVSALTEEYITSPICGEISLCAQKIKNSELFETTVNFYNFTNTNNHLRSKTIQVYSQIDYETLLKLVNNLYAVLSINVDPDLIIHNKWDTAVSAYFGKKLQTRKIHICSLTDEQRIEMMEMFKTLNKELKGQSRKK